MSMREGRKGPAMANWIYDEAKKRIEFETEMIDLKKINLPFLDEPEHPRLKHYTRQTTKEWSRIIEASDAFIAVTPEYNYGYPAPLKNALDTLYKEWNNKPFGFVSYGGIAGGTRCMQLIQPVLLALKMAPVLDAVNIPLFTNQLDARGKFIPNQSQIIAAGKLFDGLVFWGELLRETRSDNLINIKL